MEDIREKKRELRIDVTKTMEALSVEERSAKTAAIENRLFEFANFLESKITLLYVHRDAEVNTAQIIKKCFDYHKIVVLPAFNTEKNPIKLMKLDDFEADLKMGPRQVMEPDPERCKVVPIDCIDIAIIPGIAFDEKGGRIGYGTGFYDKLIPALPVTTRKVALAHEIQILPQIPMESHDKHVDIIVTEERVIYKI